MVPLHEICAFLERFAPSDLAEDWDNVGLLVGDRSAGVQRVMTCLTITPASAGEAIAERTELIVAHHPLPFRPLKRLTRDTTPGRLLLDLIGGGVAVYSPHTAFDSAAGGINQRLAEGLGLQDITPLEEIAAAGEGVGAGRQGVFDPAVSLAVAAAQLKAFLGIQQLQAVGDTQRTVRRVAVACGAAGEFLDRAQQLGCDLFITGETTFHTCLEAEASDVALLLTGHFASERFAVEQLAGLLAEEFPQLHVWSSRRERTPLAWI
jgi:dinuclear metal center YbgI/SA1388 family protein